MNTKSLPFVVSVMFFVFDMWLISEGATNTLSICVTTFQLGLVILTGYLWLKG